MTQDNAASREARALELLNAEIEREGIMGAHIARRQGVYRGKPTHTKALENAAVRAIVAALVDEAASQPREGVTQQAYYQGYKDGASDANADADMECARDGWHDFAALHDTAPTDQAERDRAIYAQGRRDALEEHDIAPTDQAKRGEVERLDREIVYRFVGKLKVSEKADIAKSIGVPFPIGGSSLERDKAFLRDVEAKGKIDLLRASLAQSGDPS